MIRRSTVSLLLVLLAVPACNNEVIVPGASTSASSGATGTGGGTSGGPSATTSGVGGTPITVGVGGSGGIAPVCGAETHDGLSLMLMTSQGDVVACTGDSSAFDFKARVVSNDGTGHLLLDSCSPAADCIEELNSLSIKAPGLYTDIPLHAYVRVRGAIQSSFGRCVQQIQITNLPSWDGDPNPVFSEAALWLIGMDGGQPFIFDDTPIIVTPIPLGCFQGEPVACVPHDDYTFQFQGASNHEDPGTIVSMGQMAFWEANLPSGDQLFAVRNLRSFSQTYCDEGPSDFAYWVTHQTPHD
jgi:hypothetical protein